MCFGLALTIGAPIGGMVLNRFGPRVLWLGTFGIAITAVVIYAMIHRTITQRVENAVDE
jgi:predicted MFS family arabinose efflux permease